MLPTRQILHNVRAGVLSVNFSFYSLNPHESSPSHRRNFGDGRDIPDFYFEPLSARKLGNVPSVPAFS